MVCCSQAPVSTKDELVCKALVYFASAHADSKTVGVGMNLPEVWLRAGACPGAVVALNIAACRAIANL